MSDTPADRNYKAVAIANDVCAPLLKSKNEARCWLDIAQRRYDEAWRGAYDVALKALEAEDK